MEYNPVFPTTIGLAIFTILLSDMVKADDEYLNLHRIDLDGVPELSYPQVCIRTNRQAARIPLNEKLTEFQAKYPSATSEEMMFLMMEWASSGVVGHSWINFFYKDSNGKVKSDQYGFGSQNNDASRQFSFQKCVFLNEKYENIKAKVTSEIKGLYDETDDIAKMFNGVGRIYDNRVYTIYGNCSWFSGRLFNSLVNKRDRIDFAQPFDWDKVAELFGWSELKKLKDLPDPGYIAESIAKVINAAGYNPNWNQGYIKLTGSNVIGFDSALNMSSGEFLSQIPALVDYANFIEAGYYSESLDEIHLFTNNLSQNIELIYSQSTNKLSKKDINEIVIAAFPSPYDHKYGFVINKEGDVIDARDWTLVNKSALKKYANRITAATNYSEEGRVLVLLRPDNNQVDVNRSTGPMYIIYDFENDVVITKPNLIESLSGGGVFRLN